MVRLFVTRLKGNSIYDVTKPLTPLPLGIYSFPHSQNGAVQVSDDGKRLIISTDSSLVRSNEPRYPRLRRQQPSGDHETSASFPLSGSEGPNEPATAEISTPEWPPGISLRPYREDHDDRLMWDVMRAGFGDDWPADSDAEGWIKNLAVAPQARKTGVGRAMLFEAFRRVKARGRARAVLGVHVNNPTDARSFYLRVGMTQSPNSSTDLTKTFEP